jgi:hypothetical protein
MGVRGKVLKIYERKITDFYDNDEKFCSFTGIDGLTTCIE